MIPQRTEVWYISQALIAINVVVFIVGVALGDGLFGGGEDGLVREAATWGAAVDVYGEWWRVFTGGFLHHGVLHLAVNMYSLYLLGLAMERWLGKVPFVAVYLASLVAGSFGALLDTPNALVAGASGAIFGLMGAYGVLLMSQGFNLFQTPIGPILVFNLFISFVVDGISLGGHLGGLIGGALVGTAAALAFRQQRYTTAVPVIAGVVVAGGSFVGALWAASRWMQAL